MFVECQGKLDLELVLKWLNCVCDKSFWILNCALDSTHTQNEKKQNTQQTCVYFATVIVEMLVHEEI